MKLKYTIEFCILYDKYLKFVSFFLKFVSSWPLTSECDTQKCSMSISTSFETALKQVLKHFGDAAWLEQNSALASYYFLGSFLTEETFAQTQSRGELLQQAIRRAAETLWTSATGDHHAPNNYERFSAALIQAQKQPGGAVHSFVLLELRCFQRFIKPKRLSEIWEHHLPSSRAEHYRDYDDAIVQLGVQLLHQFQPTFRLESAPIPKTLIGVETQLTHCLDALNQGESVCIHGPGGVGKSSLAAAIIDHGGFDHYFWFTVRPTLNDHLPSLLFMLGFFLQRQGATNLWQLLMLNAGKVDDFNLALSVAQHDLTTLSGQRLVLCFDELELLQVTDHERVVEAHSQILRFIEGLHGHAPLLLITQRPTLSADHYLELTGLATPNIRRLLQPAGIDLYEEELRQLYHYTHGNLRLLHLVSTLLQRGVSLTALLDGSHGTLTLLPLLHRLLPRLAAAERQLFQQLAIFRSAAPLDEWAAEQEQLQVLIEQRLVQRDGKGGIFLLPALRLAIYEDLSTDLRVRLHRQAAQIRAVRGEYTAAAYHLWQGGDESGAVQLWYPHRQQEIERGQASAAYAIFGDLARHRLKKTERNVLDLIRAELLQYQGNVKQGLALLEAEDWAERSELAIRAKLLQGRFQDELGYPHAALTTFAAGEATIQRLLDQLTNYHYRAGMVQLRQKENPAAWQALQRAEYAINALRGNLFEQEGDYTAAHDAYTNALAQAEQLQLAAERARIHRFLSALYGRQGKMNAAIAQADAAAMVYQSNGDLLNLNIVHSTLSAIHLGRGDYEQVLSVGLPALRFFEEMGNAHFVATTACNLAEASYELGNFTDAQYYASLALDQEEPYAYPYAHYTLGLTRQAQGDVATAEQHLLESRRFAAQSQDVYMEAFAHRALGTLYRAEQQASAAHRCFAAALALFERLEITSERDVTAALIEELDAKDA